jgi:acetyltransferase-like isoleucine patch superfamily enzyme
MKQSDEAIIKFFKKYELCFFWLRWFYPKAKGVPLHFLLYCFVPQKLFRINGRVPWPVHFTSRVLYPKNIKIGNNSVPGMAGSCYIQARNGIIIGHNLWTGPGVGLISSNHDLDNYEAHVEKGPIMIGDNVWIGMNAVVMPGVKIGDNVVVGANSVVTNDIPPNRIAAGNPCRVIRKKNPYKGMDYAEL